MQFRVDPWDPAYGTSLDAELGESTAEVEADVEVAAARWGALSVPTGIAAPEAVLFVDGVRRVDAQVWVDEPDGATEPGLCASYAAGVVCCCAAQRAHLRAVQVRRGVFTTAAAAAEVATPAGRYDVVRAAARRDVAPMQLLSLALQRDLAELELRVAAEAREDHASGMAQGLDGRGDLLVVDGPLRGRQHLPRTIGFVKTHRSGYLPPHLGAVVASLGAAERTPVFRLGSSWERYSWYLRLPGGQGTPWAGIVRVECGADLSVEQAVGLARLSQVTLPRYASVAYKDSRAPQNLYPIGGLERALRRRLGDAALLYRALRRAAGSTAAPA